MDDVEYDYRRGLFVEDFAGLMEKEGLPRMYGRVLGFLLIAHPNHQSSAQLADGLNASRGAISTATRALVEAGFVHRKKIQGERSLYFEVRPDTMSRVMHASALRLQLTREVAERGLALLDHREDVDRSRLGGFRDVLAFMEDEFPRLLERWEQKRRETPK